MAIDPGFRRVLLGSMVALGLVLALSPFVAQTALTWFAVMKPAIDFSVNPEGLEKEKIQRLNNSEETRKLFTRNPLLLGTTFVAAPAGLAMIAVGMRGLRRLRRPGGPVWPAGYTPGRTGRG